MRTLASGASPRAELHLALVRIHPLWNLAPNHLEMVLVNPGLHPVPRAPVPTLPRVMVPGPRTGQNSLSGACASSISSPVSLVA